MRPLSLTEGQRRAADPARSVWVRASAGSGKTSVLTGRVLRLLLAGCAPQRILCITFTKAAAAEMANRVARQLERWAVMDDGALDADLRMLLGAPPGEELRVRARRLFALVLDAPGRLRILTIHAFCQSVLRRFPIESGVPPHFEVLEERDAAEALFEAREAVLARARAGGILAHDLAVITNRAAEETFTKLLEAVLRDRPRVGTLLAEPGWRQRLRRAIDVAEDATVASIVADACNDEAVAPAALRAAAEALLDSRSVTDNRCGERIARWLENPARRCERFDDYLQAFFTAELATRQRLATKTFSNAFPRHAAALQDEAERLSRVIDARNRAALAEASEALVRVGGAVLDEYERSKHRRGRLDYDDLILKTGELLRRPGVAAWVLYKLDEGIDHVLVDEAQDTSPEQWDVLTALTDEFFAGEGAAKTARTLFAVGDPKQSIYSFQRADPLEFLRRRDDFKKRFAEQEHRLRQGFEEVPLTVSFRSVSAVLEAVDRVFAGADARRGVAFGDEPIAHQAHRGRGGLVEVWPPLVPEAAPAPLPWAPPVEQERLVEPRTRLARTIAATIRSWIDKGEPLASRGRPVRAGDVMVLVRRRNEFVTDLVRALKQEGVPVAGSDRMTLAEQLAVEDLLALGEFLVMPDDELTLATVLKSPLVGWNDAQLFDLAWRRKGTLWAELRRRAPERLEFAAADKFLGDLLARADFVPPFELFAEVLGAGGGRRAALGRLGPEAGDPLDEFLALALAYERQHVPSLQGFLHWMRTGRTEIKRDLDQSGRDEVRVMTVHGAKGLQAPIVFLPDTCQVTPLPLSLFWTENGLPLWCRKRALDPPAAAAARADDQRRREEEYRRLLYVAMTRAEERLYVCGWETKSGPVEGSWHGLVRDALKDTAEKAETPAGEGLRLHHEVERVEPLREARLLEDQQTVLPAWARAFPDPEPVPARPLTPSQPLWREPPARSPLAPPPATGAASGVKRGFLVHRLLQALPELPPPEREDACRRFLARSVHGLAPDEQSAIARETLAVLADPEFAPLFAPESLAEVPIVGLVGDHALSGQIDRLVVTRDEVLIVDYKTLRPAPETAADIPDAYLRQLALYVAAVEKIWPDRPVRAALLWTDAPRLMPVPHAALAGHAP